MFRKELEIPLKGILDVEISIGTNQSLVINAFEITNEDAYSLTFEK